MENLAFLIARRRNQLRRGGTKWIADLEARTGIESGGVQLMPAEESIRRERRMRSLLSHGLASGDVMRVRSCALPDAVSGWDAALTRAQRMVVVCELFRHPDYVFRVPASCLLGKLSLLLDFDGDTVGVTSDDLLSGFMVDMHFENGEALYEADVWGAWKG